MSTLRSARIILISAAWSVKLAVADCLSNPDFNEFFVNEKGGTIPLDGSCCQSDVCNIPCPKSVDPPPIGYGVAVGCAIGISFIVGAFTYFLVNDKAENYFVAGHSLPLWIVAVTLGAASVDSNALLGNADLSYTLSFYDGACLPIGLGLSLIINGIFLAEKINKEKALTLPDVYARRYGKTVEVLVSLTTITSFLMLLAGNFVGMGFITAYVWGVSQTSGIYLTAAIIWLYTVSGGLFAVAYADVIQGVIGWSGCFVASFWMIANYHPNAPPPSVGFPEYIYPNEEICLMYDGVPCTYNTSLCCYNATRWCDANGTNCFTDNGAYPLGDKQVYSDQMTNPQALTPFPNAIFWNWCTIIILAFGNLAALDFQVRCMAAKTPRTASLGCIIGGLFTLFIGLPFSYLGSITRIYYGPDSVHAEFDTDTCSTILGVATCGAWLPDSESFLKLMTNQAPPVIGAWCLAGIITASMSTASGAILAMGTVFSHNIMRQLDAKFPSLITAKNLLLMARLASIPFTIISACLAAYYKKTGYLLIVAFDIVLASAVVPLVGGFYIDNPSPRAAFCSVVAGIICRVTLEFALPKDGFLLLPYNLDEFYNYGAAASTGLPTFVDGSAGSVWDPATQQCSQEQFKDYTGVDSLSSFLCAILVYLTVQFWEYKRGGEALFTLPGMVPYEKDFVTAHSEQESEKIDRSEKTFGILSSHSDENSNNFVLAETQAEVTT